MTKYSLESIWRFPAIPLFIILCCLVVPAIVVQFPWYVIVALPFGLAGYVYLTSRPALALAIQCCGFYIALFVLDILGISTSTLITAGFHVVLASCYLAGVARAKFFFKSLFHPTTVFFGFMIFWFGINWYLYSQGSDLGITKIGFMLTMMLPVFIGIHLFDLEQFEKFRFYSIALGFIGLALAAMSMFVLGDSTDEFGRFRVTPSANPLAFAYPLGISTLFMFSLALEKDAKHKLVAALMIASSLFFVLSTGSRGPILALFASIIVLLWWVGIRRWLRFVPISIIAILVIGAALLPFIPESALDRIYSVTNFLNDGSLSTANAIFTDRLRLWQLSLNLWLRHPWTGIGLGNMGVYYIGKQSFAHNFILELLSETGGIGFSIFVVNMIGAVAAAFHLYKIKDKISIAPSIIALAIFSLFNISVSGQITSAIPLWIAYGGLVRLSILGKQLKPSKALDADDKDAQKLDRGANKIAVHNSGLRQKNSGFDRTRRQRKPNVETNINSAVVLGKHFTVPEASQVDRHKSHKLADMLIISICTVICGGVDYSSMQAFGKAKEKWFATFLELPNGIPSADTFSQVFGAIDPERFQEYFLTCMSGITPARKDETISLDDAESWRNHNKNDKISAFQMTDVWTTSNRIMLGRTKAGRQSKRTTTIPKFLNWLELYGCLVTSNAIEYQANMAQQIIDQGGEYLFPLKSNQLYLHEDIELIFDELEKNRSSIQQSDNAKSVDKENDHTETRHCWTISDPELIQRLRGANHFANLETIAKIRTEQYTDGHISLPSIKERYFVSSSTFKAADILRLTRSHGQAQELPEQVLDIDLQESNSSIRESNSIQNFTILHHMALNALESETSAKIGIKNKRIKAERDTNYLLNILAFFQNQTQLDQGKQIGSFTTLRN